MRYAFREPLVWQAAPRSVYLPTSARCLNQHTGVLVRTAEPPRKTGDNSIGRYFMQVIQDQSLGTILAHKMRENN